MFPQYLYHAIDEHYRERRALSETEQRRIVQAREDRRQVTRRRRRRLRSRSPAPLAPCAPVR